MTRSHATRCLVLLLALAVGPWSCGDSRAPGDVPDAGTTDGSSGTTAGDFDLEMGWHEPTYGDHVDLLQLEHGMEIPRIWGLQGSPMIVLGFTGPADAIDVPYVDCTFVRADDGTDLADPKYRDEIRMIEQDDGRLRHDHFFMILVDEAVDPDGSTTARLDCDFCGATGSYELELVDP